MHPLAFAIFSPPGACNPQKEAQTDRHPSARLRTAAHGVWSAGELLAGLLKMAAGGRLSEEAQLVEQMFGDAPPKKKKVNQS